MKYSRPRVKVCCISNHQELALATRYGASALGFVSDMPSGPGVISLEQIRQLSTAAPPAISRFLLSSQTKLDAILEQMQHALTDTLQLVDAVEKELISQIRKAMPAVKIVAVIHVTDESAPSQAIDIAPACDALLLDSGAPQAKTKELGGTGRVHDWSISRAIVEAVPIPVFLAGGLKEENILAAVKQVQPFGVDLCSGVRSHGQLDEEKLRRFMSLINSIPSP